jgi:hypothetical protein
MYKFLFRKDSQVSRLDKSIIIKEFDGKKHHLVEADFGLVSQELGISEEEAVEVTKAVLKSIFRIGTLSE